MAIRVLHVIANLGLGGAQVLVKQIAENADPKKTKIIVYPLRWADMKIPIRGNLIQHPLPNYDPRKFFTLLRLCREQRIDLIHAHLEKPILGALLSAYVQKIPVLIHEHGPVCRSGPQYVLYRFLLRRMRQKASAVIAVSDYIARIMKTRLHINEEKIHVFPNAVNFTPFDTFPLSRREARKKLNLPSDKIILGFSGRLNVVKGADLAIHTLRKLNSGSSDYFLILAGEGKQRPALETLARTLNLTDSIRFLGFQSEIAPVMAACDIALVPSRQESFGIVALEWMRMKVPLVTSGAGGLKEFITTQQTGLIVPENTPEGLAQAVLGLLESADLKNRLIQQAYELTRQYEIGPYMEKLTALYERLVHPEAPPSS